MVSYSDKSFEDNPQGNGSMVREDCFEAMSCEQSLKCKNQISLVYTWGQKYSSGEPGSAKLLGIKELPDEGERE